MSLLTRRLKRGLRALILILSGLGLSMAFQNCSPGFKTQTDLGQLSESSVLSAPNVQLINPLELYSQANISFNILAQSTSPRDPLSTITCQLDNLAPQDCSNFTVAFVNVVDGDHTLTVAAQTQSGLRTEFKHLFRKDATAPVIMVSMMPAVVTNQTSAQFAFSVSDNLSGVQSIECSYNNAAFSSCTSPINLTNLAAGAHNYQIRAADRAANSSLVYSHNWTVDLTAPTVNLTAMPLAVTNQVNATFSFSGAGIVSYECQIDNAAYASCTSPQAYLNLAANSHTFRVRGTNAAGTTSAPAQFVWSIDNVAPLAPQIATNVVAISNLRTASFNFSSTDVGSGLAGFQCSLNNATFSACISPLALSALTDGSHNLRVRSLDLAGNLSTESAFAWIVDATLPALAFTQTPLASTNLTTASFTFTVTEPNVASVQCSLDNVAFSNCTSPINLSNLSVSAHTFRVQARDTAGNMALVSFAWTVTAAAPEPSPVSPGGPSLFFTDLASAPRTGNSDTSFGQTPNQNGALVTLWGKNLGASQGTSTITVGGVPALVYYWGPAQRGGGANLSVRMGIQMIEFQIPGSVSTGVQPILVRVNNVASNSLNITLRDEGRIYFIGQNGNDNATGTFATPWKNFEKALATMGNGDIVYLLNGFIDNTLQGADGGLISLSSSGTAILPKAVVAYPGATATIGGSVCGDRAMVHSYNYSTNSGSTNWTISKLRIQSPATCPQDVVVSMGSGYRIVGSYLSNPRTSDGCQSGVIQCGGGVGACGDNIYILGNELEGSMTANAATGSKQCHGIYISGDRSKDGLETNREIAWNYIHDNSNNRAINIYNESLNGATSPRALITGHKVHDNWLQNQRGVGVLFGSDIIGENWFYNNVMINTGIGPRFADDGTFFPLQVSLGSGYKPTPTRFYAYNNLIYGTSFPELLTTNPNLFYTIGMVLYSVNSMVTTEFRNNIIVVTKPNVGYLAYDTKGFISSNNIWFGAGAAPAGETQTVIGDPLFVNPAVFDFHLRTGSPAIGTSSVAPAWLSLDFDGNPKRSPANVGPY